MGKGDVKTKRGKIFKGTFGVSRPHKVTVVKVETPKKKKATPKKKAAK
jgi:30S ribosomal protein S31